MHEGISIKLVCTQFPGLRFGAYHPVHVGIQKDQEIVDAVPGDVTQKEFIATVRFNQDKQGKPNFLGPFVFGPTGDRFLYLVWFTHEERFRRAKIKLNHLTWDQVQQARESGQSLVARVLMTDKKGEPACASLKGDLIRWEYTTGH